MKPVDIDLFDRRDFLMKAGSATTLALAAAGRGFAAPGRKETPALQFPPLPYDQKGLEPAISANTLSFHYGRHHQGYFNNVVKMIAGTEFENMALEDIIQKTAGRADQTSLFNNAAQVFNHTFYWNSMKPGGGGEPAGRIGDRIRAALDEQQRTAVSPRTAVKVAPEAMASYERANASRDQGRLDEAEQQYREAIGIDPRFAEAHNNLGSVLGRQGRSAEAIAEISRALEIAPGLPAAHNNLGIVLAMRGDAEQAARHFAEVLRLTPHDAGAHYNLGVLLARQGRLAEAISHYEEALRIDPGYQSATRALEDARRRLSAAHGQ